MFIRNTYLIITYVYSYIGVYCYIGGIQYPVFSYQSVLSYIGDILYSLDYINWTLATCTI